MARRDGKFAEVWLKRLRCWHAGGVATMIGVVLAAGVALETELAPSGMLDLWNQCFKLVEFPRMWRSTCRARIGVTR